MHSSLFTAIILGTAPFAFAVRTIIPKTCFDSRANFDLDLAYNYPWGTDHNGGARMDQPKASISDGVLTLTATPATGQKPASCGGKFIPINHLSGTVHGIEHYNVSCGGEYDFTCDFQATTTKGTWPAFWLTAVQRWPPEIDMAEWKGSGKISFNTFNTSSLVAAKDVTYSSPGNWHPVKTEIRDENGKDLSMKFYLDGHLQMTQYGNGFLGQSMYLIADLQMEGSSGSPGPCTVTEFKLRNLEVLSYNP